MKLTETLHKARFHWNVRAIERTPPLAPGEHPFTVLSMVQHRDVLAYLLALKSFARYLPPAEVVVVADPSLTAEDRALLKRHVPHLCLRDAAEFRPEGLPRGGCWERLTAIAQHVDRGYVVQLDADTVTLAFLSDVASAIRDDVCFTLGTEDGQQIGATARIAAWARGRLDGKDHVQLLAESMLDRFDPQARHRYVRGCAGFAGFARRSIDPALLLDVSARMGRLLGERWSDWGSEQFTSNLLVASSPGARVLPHPEYCAPHRRTSQSIFLHFIGYVRFTTGHYPLLARRVSAELR